MKKIKIQTKHRRRTYDEIWIPEIKMEGRWLEKLGFNQGKHVRSHNLELPQSILQ